MRKQSMIILLVGVLILTFAGMATAWTPLAVEDDPLVRMPGSQPGTLTLEGPGRCLNCHAGYNQAVEPGFNWKGSMMAQASRDFLFWSCMTVSAQDVIAVVGNPNATDICERCHFPIGWIEGRSDPTNASRMTGDDYDGVNCDFCHKMYDPFFEDTFAGTREGSDWVNYWDEASGGIAQSRAADTRLEDSVQAQNVLLFSGNPLFDTDNRPFYSSYTINGGGQYFLSAGSAKRASFADDGAKHKSLYSRYHKSKYFCATCHDISNPVLANLGLSGLPDQSGGVDLITEQYPSYKYFHVERTFSEFMLSEYGLQGGAPGVGPFAPQLFETSYADNNIAKCQDCHMRDVAGYAANKNGIPFRPDGSSEHPESGVPLHDMTGGNAWVSYVLASAMPNSPNFNQLNFDLLNQGPATLTLDMTAGRSADPVALLAGVDRSKQQLELAAAINDLGYDSATGALSFKVQNHTGHKLISGFPEGRRMFLNIKAYVGGSLAYEVNPYDPAAGTLKGMSYPYQAGQGVPAPQTLASHETVADDLIYEAHTSSTITSEEHTLHFALATDRYKDNRIPPKGFRIDEAEERFSEPKWHGAVALDYFTDAEYAGGYDGVSITVPANADYVEVNLYYQTTSREYVEFLRDEINGTGNLTMDPAAYIIQTDPFFAGLKAWGSTMWQLWLNNKDVPGGAPYLMTQSVFGTPPGGGCTVPAVPALDPATPGNAQVSLSWSAVTGADGYRVYYDQAGKAQLIADVASTTFTDSSVTNGVEYCYKVTAYSAECESAYSEIECSIPDNQGLQPVGATVMETGYYSGATWVPSTTFTIGDAVVVRGYVEDSTGTPVSGATVNVSITGPANANLVSDASDAAGIAEVSWQTKVGKGKNNKGGTAAGNYNASTSGVTASGYEWDNVTTNTNFSVQ